MREILFRGKTDKGEWVRGVPFFEEDRCYIIEDLFICDEYNCTGAVNLTVIPDTVGQCTGLNDKNDNKIFEGDIIKFGISQRLMYVHWNEETLTWELTDVGVSACEVNHLINTFELGEIQVESAYGEIFSEIVGNIHDNPELLKGGEWYDR